MTRAGYSAISSYSRVALLDQLQKRPDRTIGELTAATGLHANTVREHLRRLISGGYVVARTEHRAVRGRPRMLYSAVSRDCAVASPIARRKAADAARRGDLMRRVLGPCGRNPELPDVAVHQIDALVEDLSDAGFDPFVDEEELTVDLSPCQHSEDPEQERDMLCRVHIALMDGVLASAGGPLEVEGFVPGCDPSACIVRLKLKR